MARKQRTKVRTGCFTCKIRRIKCDEGKPNCSRCHSTGRICDGYYRHVYPGILHRQPPQAPASSLRRQGDARALQFFSTTVAPSFWAPHNASFWTDHVPMLCNSEEAIRHSTIALSLLYEEFLSHGRVSAQTRPSESFLYHFGSAVQHLRATQDQHLVLVGCLLFVCIEALQFNHEQANMHARHGIRIFKAFNATDAWKSPDLGPIFDRLGAIPLLPSSGCPRPIVDPGKTISPPLSLLCEAEPLLEVLIVRAARLFHSGEAYRYGALRAKPVSGDLLAEQQEIRELVERIQSSISCFDRLPAEGRHRDAWYFAIMIRVEVSRIRTLQAFDQDETSYDMFNDDFHAIVRLAQHPGCAMRLIADTAPGTEFRSEISHHQIAYFVATKCRHLATRLAALKLLSQHSNSNEPRGCSVNKFYLYARRIIEVEHSLTLNRWDQPLGPVDWTELPPKEARAVGTLVKPHDMIRTRIRGRSIIGNPEGFIMRSGHGGLSHRIEFITVVTGDNSEFIQLENCLTRPYSPLHEVITPSDSCQAACDNNSLDV